MSHCIYTRTCQNVVLLAEDVDRNMDVCACKSNVLKVVLLAEDVDRNYTALQRSSVLPCRPPRGGRG